MKWKNQGVSSYFLKTLFFILSLCSFFTADAAASRRQPALLHEGYFVQDLNFLKTVKQLPALTVDHVSPKGFEVWGPKGLGAWLTKSRVRFTSLRSLFMTESCSGNEPCAYPSPEQINQELLSISKAYPQITKLFSIGKSVKGRELAVMKLSSHVERNDNRPEFKFIANMHGDEIVGRELMMMLIKDLVQNYGKDPFITQIMDQTQIYIMPSMNPDGASASTRGNANMVDLNRDFPDFSTNDNQNTPENRQPETQAVMRWQATRKFVLSANFHGGAECVSYMWDTTKDRHPKDSQLQSLALSYAKLAPYIGNSSIFKNGITNGYDWYEVDGGMQDWSNYWHGDTHFTIELSQTKWPPSSKVDYYYQQNRKALLSMISQAAPVARARLMSFRRPGR